MVLLVDRALCGAQTAACHQEVGKGRLLWKEDSSRSLCMHTHDSLFGRIRWSAPTPKQDRSQDSRVLLDGSRLRWFVARDLICRSGDVIAGERGDELAFRDSICYRVSILFICIHMHMIAAMMLAYDRDVCNKVIAGKRGDQVAFSSKRTGFLEC